MGVSRGGLWVQEAEKRQGLLWDAVELRGKKIPFTVVGMQMNAIYFT